jgi:hypothetical protein
LVEGISFLRLLQQLGDVKHLAEAVNPFTISGIRLVLKVTLLGKCVAIFTSMANFILSKKSTYSESLQMHTSGITLHLIE